jgi:hypothetical protein
MYFQSKKTSLIILAITAMLCSRATFLFINDPEGPNLLIVMVLAVTVYLLSLTTFLFKLPIVGIKRLLLAIFSQMAMVACLLFLLH